MTVFRSKTFKKNRSRTCQKGKKGQKNLWRGRVRRTMRGKGSKRGRQTKHRQHGGYVPYRENPKGGVTADVLDWDDQKGFTEEGT